MPGPVEHITYARVIAGIYRGCLNPSERDLPLENVLQEIELQDAALCTDLDLSDQLWRTETRTISVDPSADEYRVPDAPADAIGRPVLAEIEQTGQERSRRRIYIADLPDQDRHTGTQRDHLQGIYIGREYPIQEIGFFRKDNEMWCRISPYPARHYGIRVMFEARVPLMGYNEDTPSSVASAAVIAYPLLIKKTCLALLPGLSHKPDSVIERALRSLAADAAELKERWHQFVLQDSEEEPSGIIYGFRLGFRTSGRRWY